MTSQYAAALATNSCGITVLIQTKTIIYKGFSGKFCPSSIIVQLYRTWHVLDTFEGSLPVKTNRCHASLLLLCVIRCHIWQSWHNYPGWMCQVMSRSVQPGVTWHCVSCNVSFSCLITITSITQLLGTCHNITSDTVSPHLLTTHYILTFNE